MRIWYAVRINKIIQSDVEFIIFVLDLKKFAINYGEPLNFLMLARYLFFKGKKIKIIVIADEVRELKNKWCDIDYFEKWIDQFKELVNFLLPECELNFYKFKNLKNLFSDKNSIILYKIHVYLRLQFYHNNTNLIQELIANESEEYLNKFLLINNFNDVPSLLCER